jgi:hypothetical protein
MTSSLVTCSQEIGVAAIVHVGRGCFYSKELLRFFFSLPSTSWAANSFPYWERIRSTERGQGKRKKEEEKKTKHHIIESALVAYLLFPIAWRPSSTVKYAVAHNV